MLIFILKKCWYDKIASGEKEIEYREVKPYWSKRLAKLFPPGLWADWEKAFADNNEKIGGVEFGTLARPLCQLRKAYTSQRLTAKIKKIQIVNGANTDLKINKPVYAFYLQNIKDAK